MSLLSSQISNIVLADGSPSDGPRLTFANGVWVNLSHSFKSTFKDVVTSAYKTRTKAFDFWAKVDKARQEVNCSVQNKTSGFINELLPTRSLDEMTRPILGNPLYFKGAWNKRFDASQAKNSEFSLLDGITIQAPFISSKEKQYISAYNDFKVLEMPYNKQCEDERFTSVNDSEDPFCSSDSIGRVDFSMVSMEKTWDDKIIRQLEQNWEDARKSWLRKKVKVIFDDPILREMIKHPTFI
ncbi:hypothetical protein IEQ34_004175 [Dendrobium chrysotoxum]|uniref:Serpin domain-containing protein n=1 Tax=Dendrobium chrysotoxum TaxID=161865 RepID=A0AAV7HGE7_DENCH|nr:hypothetical protein IEQ34_004175 [Dendrobium chrysotoxum]